MDKNILTSKNIFLNFYKIFLLLILSFTISTSQAVEVSVPFQVGFIGTTGQNSGKADVIKTFSTLGINRAFFVQNSTTNTFQLQGNDISGFVRLQLNNGQLIDIPGAIVWRITSGSTLECFGFIPASTILNLIFSGLKWDESTLPSTISNIAGSFLPKGVCEIYFGIPFPDGFLCVSNKLKPVSSSLYNFIQGFKCW
jgi:hypothetical protein